MLTVIIRDSGEPSVIKLTYENIYKELKDIPDAEIIVAEHWMDPLHRVANKFVCLIEPDCLVSSGYFTSLVGHIKKNPQFGKLGILSSATAVNNWAVKFYGYNIGENYTDGILPNKNRKDTKLPFYTHQIAYIPGALIRANFLKKVLPEIEYTNSWENDLVYMSMMLSTAFWRKNWMVYIAPNSTYCTTEDYVNDIGKFNLASQDLHAKFLAESI